MINSTATRLLFDKKKVSGVEFVYNNRLYTVRVRKEVVLSAGAVNSPHLLLLSGVGPKNELSRVGIPQVHELPGVGRNLQNHVTFYMTYTMKKRKAVNDLDWATALDFLINRKGPMTSTGMSQVTARINTKYADPSGTHPDLQIFFAGYLAKCSKTGEARAVEDPANPDGPRHLTVSPVVLHPKSRGFIALKSKNPLDAPLMYANYLSEPEDLATLVEGVRVVQKLGATKVLQDKYGLELIKEDYGDCIKNYRYDSDEYWACGVKHSTGPENHQAGSCKMGPATDHLAVVNNKLEVHGLEGVRVMDASIMPTLVSGNTHATCVMIADVGVDHIKRKHLNNVLEDRASFGEGAGNGNSQVNKPAQKPVPPYQSPQNHQHNNNQGFQHNYNFHQQNPQMPNPFHYQNQVQHPYQTYQPNYNYNNNNNNQKPSNYQG